MSVEVDRAAADDRRLAVHLVAARIGCLARVAVGCAGLALALVYELAIARALVMPPFMAVLLGVVPAAVGLYVVVRAAMRWRVFDRVARRPESIELIELAMRWGRPALRVAFVDGASETLSTGATPRDRLIAALRRRGAARALPAARVTRT
ncbi:MAG: hypothetical protein K8W52_42960 [Deltaproteobacteria bacterium]|nr:hypothetical protein [Deltaproteobacteria bacterium]